MVQYALEFCLGLWENLCSDFEIVEIQTHYLFPY